MLEMIQKNKGKLIFSSLLIMLPIFAGLLLWRKVPLLPLFFWQLTGSVCFLFLMTSKTGSKAKRQLALFSGYVPRFHYFLMQ